MYTLSFCSIEINIYSYVKKKKWRSATLQVTLKYDEVTCYIFFLKVHTAPLGGGRLSCFLSYLLFAATCLALCQEQFHIILFYKKNIPPIEMHVRTSGSARLREERVWQTNMSVLQQSQSFYQENYGVVMTKSIICNRHES